MKSLACLLTSVSVFFFAIAQAENLLPEAKAGWTKNWKSAYGCSVDKVDGKEVLKQYFPEDYHKGNHAWSIAIPTQAGAKYRFTVRYKAKDVGEAFGMLHFIYPDGTPMPWLNFREFTKKITGTQEQWAELTHEFKAPAGSASLSVGLRLNAPGTIWWDAPSIEMTEAPAKIVFKEDEQKYDLSDSVGVVVREIPLEKILPLNIHWLRYNVGWGTWEKEGKGIWNEEYIAKDIKLLSDAKKAGIKVMVSIGYPPRWAARKDEGVKGGSHVARSQEDWASFVSTVVTRLGDNVDCYRIMNEVDHQWDSGAQPAEYTEFLKTAYKTIKSIRPSVTVVMAGLSGTPGGYLQNMYEAGAGKSMDVVACQPYPSGAGGNVVPEESRFVERLRAYRMVMASNGDSRPLWVTETGITSEPLAKVTRMEQAAYEVRTHLLMFTSGAGVAKVFFYLLRDEKGDDCSQTGGLYTREWEMKPLGKALSVLAEVIRPVSRYVGEIKLGGDKDVYNRFFETKEGGQIWAVWRSKGTSKMKFSFNEPVEKVSWDGDRSKPSKSFEVTLDGFPVYFIGKMPELVAKADKAKEIGFEAIASAKSAAQPVLWVDGTPTEEDWKNTPELPMKAFRKSGDVISKARVIASSLGLNIRVAIDDSSPAKNTVEGLHGLWTQDSTELFINLTPEQAPAGFITNKCHHFIATPGVEGKGARLYWAESGGKGMEKLVEGGQVKVLVLPNRTGYLLTVFLPWKDWSTPHTFKQGDFLGFDVVATRSNEAGERDESSAWYGGGGDAKDASIWGTIRLGGDKK